MDLNTMKLESLFEQLVPAEGPADTVAGEVVRAVNRIVYRAWNDGDMFWQGYGIETAGPAYMYLRLLDPNILQDDSTFRCLLDVMDQMEFKDFDQYYRLLQDFIDAVVQFLEHNPSLKSITNTDDCLDYYDLALDRFGDPYADDEEDFDEYDEDSYDPDGEYGADY